MFRNTIKKNDIDPDNENLIFQVIDWYATDVEKQPDSDEEEDSEDESANSPQEMEYAIKAFGVDEVGRSIGLTITGFQPYFYIEVVGVNLSIIENYNKVRRHLLEKFQRKFNIDHIPDHEDREIKVNMYGFTNNEKKCFMKIVFKNLRGFKSAVYNLKEIAFSRSYVLKVKQYESNIEPFIRFIHSAGIEPCGWIQVSKDNYDFNENILRSNTNTDVMTKWDNVKKYTCSKLAPLVVASFDIECTSSHGDFPMAIKSYKKTARELFEYYKSLKAKGSPKAEIEEFILKEIHALFNIDDLPHNVLTYVIQKKNQIIDKQRIKDESINRLDDIMKIMKDTPNTDKKIGDYFRTELKIENVSELIKALKAKHEMLKKFNKDEETIEDEIMNMMYNEFKSFNKEQKSIYIKKCMNNTGIIMSLFDNDTIFDKLAKEFDKMGCPKLEGDSIIQIGTTFHIYGQKECFYKHIITLKDCDDDFDVNEIIECNNEKQVLIEWKKLIMEMDPDIITGYNIFGFDNGYMRDRSIELKCARNFEKLGRLKDIVYDTKKTQAFITKELQSSALGQNILKYFGMEGRVQIDLMKTIQKDHKLDTYKLDAVAANFVNGKIKKVVDNNTIVIDNLIGLTENNFIKIGDSKFLVSKIDEETHTLELDNKEDIDISSAKAWGMVKDDITPNEIFEAQNKGPKERALIAKYCVQDCALCNYLMMKLEIVANNIGMANVCLVPLSYIFLRGQGIKIFSLFAEQCLQDGFIIPVIRKVDDSDDSYEGAIVLEPEIGIYEDPVSVLDFASLYPSSMISENISHDSIVLNKKYDNLPDTEYIDIKYDVNGSETTVRFAQFKNGEKGILPRILMKLLSQRKLTRKKMLYKTVETLNGDSKSGLMTDNGDSVTLKDLTTGETFVIDKTHIKKTFDTYNEFEQAVLDGLQLAYKVTANSLYGQVGAKTSPIYLQELAASTTATGRNLVMKLKDFAEENFDCKVVYGDTDSIFIKFNSLIDEKTGLELQGKVRLQASIDKSIELSKAFKPQLKNPHDAEYEKTFWPFIIMSKKRYVGNLYEEDVNKFKQKSMGIVLKRRDNANILKTVYGGMIDIILNENNVDKSIDFLKNKLQNIQDGQIDIHDLVITKTLKGSYADPSRIAHKVLADRMMDRDPGSAPQVNERVPYVYIYNKNKKALQGDRIEHPDYIKKNNVKIDYAFYITNQIMKPVSQLLSLRVEQITGYRKPANYFIEQKNKYEKDYNGDSSKVKDKINDLKESEVNKLIFEPILINIEKKAKGQTSISDFFGGFNSITGG